MNIDCPTPAQLLQLRCLWKLAFGDDEAFLDKFFGMAFSPRRCRCISENGQISAALYWFDCTCGGRKLAYLYAIATHPEHRGKGLCRTLVENTKQFLTAAGYHGALLVPEDEGLAAMYGKMGFEACTSVSEFRCCAAPSPIAIREIDISEYARLRRALLPKGGVTQESENLAFLATQARFFTGDSFLAALNTEGESLRCPELLGRADAAPGILRALGYAAGIFRAPGSEKPFAMLAPLSPDCIAPTYFGLAFD